MAGWLWLRFLFLSGIGFIDQRWSETPQDRDDRMGYKKPLVTGGVGHRWYWWQWCNIAIGTRCFRSWYGERQDKTRIRAGSKSCLLCFTRDRVKREEKEILQQQTTSLYIHIICHPRFILRAPMYHPNIQPWSYMPPTQLLSIQPRHIIQRSNTSTYFLVETNYTATFLPHPRAIPTSLDVFIFP